MRIGTDSFRVIESEGSSPLRLRVANIGAEDEIRPEARARCSLPIPPGHDLHTDFGDAPPWDARVLVVPFDENVTVDPGGTVRRYEAFLPAPGSPDRAGLALATSLAEPMAYALVGVTAADDRTHTPDHRGDPDRFGNESGVGGPATVFRVRASSRPRQRCRPTTSAASPVRPTTTRGRTSPTAGSRPTSSARTCSGPWTTPSSRPTSRCVPRPALSPADASAFPPEAVDPRWDGAKRAQVAAELNELNGLDPGDRAAAAAAYRALSNDALRVLAGLPGTEAAFTQITVQPLDPAEPDPSAPDGLRWRRVGPDVPPGVLGPGELAYVDTLDGRATNRWFYRSGHVDGVQNVGPLGLATPPVWLPDVVPPRTPTVTRLTAGDRRITIEWASNREPDLAEYRVYRADHEGAGRDVRLMDLVHVEIAAGVPDDRPATVTWTDEPVPGLVNLRYRVVAVDVAGNISAPSPLRTARAVDDTPPVVPAATGAWVPASGSVRAQIEWDSHSRDPGTATAAVRRNLDRPHLVAATGSAHHPGSLQPAVSGRPVSALGTQVHRGACKRGADHPSSRRLGAHPMPAIDDLDTRYFVQAEDASPPSQPRPQTFTNSRITPIIDADRYNQAVDAALAEVGTGPPGTN